MNRTDSTCSNVSPPQAPAFIRSALPDSLECLQKLQPCQADIARRIGYVFQAHPNPQCKTFSRPDLRKPFVSQANYNPANASFANHRFEPRPSRNTGTSRVAAYRITAAKSVSLAGVTKTAVRRLPTSCLGQRFIFQHLTFRAHQFAQCLCVGCACHV